MPMKLFFPVLFFSIFANAETVRISCHPIPYKNAATINATVVVTNEPAEEGYVKGAVVYEAVLSKLPAGSPQTRASGSLEGRVASAQLPDAQGDPLTYKTFFANSKTGDALRIQLAIGANTGITANSFIQTAEGVYYHAKCNVVSVE
jgi:hypothetical protein